MPGRTKEATGYAATGRNNQEEMGMGKATIDERQAG